MNLKSQQKLKPIFSRMLNMQRDFHDIEQFFRSIRRDELTETKDQETGEWKLTQKTLEEQKEYDLLGSIEGWCDFFKALADMYLPDYEDKPLRKLISKIRLDQPVSMDLVDQAEALLKPQRLLFLSVPSEIFNQTRIKIFEKQERKAA